ncbi:MAG: Peptidase [Clostridiales bacterium]|nr:Peptidase [Clostridiales bacterium]
MKKGWVSIGLALCLVFSNLSIANADELNDMKNQLKDVEQSINGLKGKISGVKKEKNSIYSQITKLEGQINTVENELEGLNNQIETTNNSISVTTKELETAVEELVEYKDLYSKRLRAMYMNGTPGYLEIILTSSSFSDFISRIDVVKRIMEHDSNILINMKDKQESIEKKKADLEVQKTKLVSLKQQSTSKKNELTVVSRSKKNLYTELNSDQKELEKALNAEIRESKEIEAEIKAILAAAKNSDLEYNGKIGNIVKNSEAGRSIKVTSRFGNRFHPVLKVYKLHTGIDLGVPSGTPVHAMAAGEVIIAKYSGGYGNYIVINHGSGISTLYAHNSKLLVSVGSKVKSGQVISKSGNTGYSTGPHLHFEVRKNGTPINPEPYLIIGK